MRDTRTRHPDEFDRRFGDAPEAEERLAVCGVHPEESATLIEALGHLLTEARDGTMTGLVAVTSRIDATTGSAIVMTEHTRRTALLGELTAVTQRFIRDEMD